MEARDPNSCEFGVEQFFNFVLENLTTALKSDRISKNRPNADGREWPSEKERLESAKDAIEGYSGLLIEMVQRAESRGCVPLFIPLLELLIAVYDVGQVGNVTKTANSYLQSKRRKGKEKPNPNDIKIREILESNPKIRGNEIQNALIKQEEALKISKKKSIKEINPNTFAVQVSRVKKKMGLT